jgi:hypothetical protein
MNSMAAVLELFSPNNSPIASTPDPYSKNSSSISSNPIQPHQHCLPRQPRPSAIVFRKTSSSLERVAKLEAVFSVLSCKSSVWRSTCRLIVNALGRPARGHFILPTMCPDHSPLKVQENTFEDLTSLGTRWTRVSG